MVKSGVERRSWKNCRKLPKFCRTVPSKTFCNEVSSQPETINQQGEDTLEQTGAGVTIILPDRGRTEAMSFTIVSELLGSILSEANKEVLVEARSHDFLYDPQTGMETSGMLKTTIEEGEVLGTKDKIEITLSGTVENQLAHKTTCALYFFMWWDHTTISLAKKSCNYKKTLGKNTLLFKSENNGKQLTDSVFELELYRKSPSHHQQFLGQGRGYLVFGRKV